jgi:hypothetical protein
LNNTEVDREIFQSDESDHQILDSDSNSEWDLSESESENPPESNKLFSRSNSIFEIDGDWLKSINKSGLFDFLKTNAGGTNSNRTARDTCSKLASFISWVLSQIIESNNSCYSPSDALLTAIELLVKNPQNLGEYFDYLTYQNAKPSTKLTVLCQLKKCHLWCVLHSPIGTIYDQYSFDKICCNIYRACAKQNRLRILDRGNLDNLIRVKR